MRNNFTDAKNMTVFRFRPLQHLTGCGIQSIPFFLCFSDSPLYIRTKQSKRYRIYAIVPTDQGQLTKAFGSSELQIRYNASMSYTCDVSFTNSTIKSGYSCISDKSREDNLRVWQCKETCLLQKHISLNQYLNM